MIDGALSDQFVNWKVPKKVGEKLEAWTSGGIG